MTNPPHTTDRWLLRYAWQCDAVSDHRGEYTETTDREVEQ